MQIRLSDTEKVVTVGEVIEALDSEAFIKALNLDGLIEHWTDDEGLHVQPFTKELKSTVSDAIDEIIKELL